MFTTTLASTPLNSPEQLQAAIQGDVIIPNDARYDGARQAWNLTVDQHPALIVMAKSAGDVAAAVRYARTVNLPIAVQATGHGVRRPATGAMLINTAQMNEVCVHTPTRTAWVEAGVKWQAVLDKAQAVGLAPLLGSSPDVGAVGYTLGGGMGWLARKYGLSADSVNYFEVVTHDGELVRASEAENRSLFWALRGGGGAFGVVTGMEIRLFPVTTVYGGNLIYTIDNAKAVMTRFREWIATLPDEMTAAVTLMNFPPIPEVPEPLRGRSTVIVRGCFVGDLTQGEELLRYWREWRTPLIDDFKPMPFSQVGLISNEPVDPVPGLSTGAWMASLSDQAIDHLIEYTVPHNGPPLIVVSEIRLAGGAIARRESQTSAYSHREARLSLQLVSITPTPAAKAASERHTDELKRKLQPDLTGSVYINFLEGEEAIKRTKDAFSVESNLRLERIKRQLDPENRFSFSFNIQRAA